MTALLERLAGIEQPFGGAIEVVRDPAAIELYACLVGVGGAEVPAAGRRRLLLTEREPAVVGGRSVWLHRNREDLAWYVASPATAIRGLGYIEAGAEKRLWDQPFDEPLEPSWAGGNVTFRAGKLELAIGLQREERARRIARQYARLQVSLHIGDGTELDDKAYRRQTVTLGAPSRDATGQWYAQTTEACAFPALEETRGSVPGPLWWVFRTPDGIPRSVRCLEGDVPLYRGVTLRFPAGEPIGPLLIEERP